MALLDFDPRRVLEEIRKSAPGDFPTSATAATAATGLLEKEVEKLQNHYLSTEKARVINSIAHRSEYRGGFEKRCAATAATAATAESKLSDVNDLGGVQPPFRDGYSPAIHGYSAAAKRVLARLDAGDRIDPAAVIDVLRVTNVDFMERAAISEIDGGLSREEAEQLALDEIVITWWETSPDRQKTRAILWGDVRRLAYRALLQEAAE